jgi:hypothetical protein
VDHIVCTPKFVKSFDVVMRTISLNQKNIISPNSIDHSSAKSEILIQPCENADIPAVEIQSLTTEIGLTAGVVESTKNSKESKIVESLPISARKRGRSNDPFEIIDNDAKQMRKMSYEFVRSTEDKSILKLKDNHRISI